MNQPQTVEQVAVEILEYARRSLGRALPPLIPALYLMEDVAVEEPGSLRTDGICLYYHPQTLWQQYEKDRAAPAKQLLHIILHGLLGHIRKARGYGDRAKQFDLAADTNVDAFLNSLGNAAAPYRTHRGAACCGSLEQLVEQKLDKIKPVDDHDLWRRTLADGGQDGGDGEGDGDGMETAQDLWADQTGQWQSCGEQVLQGLQDMMGEAWGAMAGTWSERIKPNEEPARPYRALLEQLLCPKPAGGENPQDLDPMLYHYGNTLGTPIVEPSEELETVNRGNLVVAVDTSGSCDGKTASEFLRELLQLLQDLGQYWRGRLAVLQCDTEIQSVVETEDIEDLRQTLLDGYQIHGLGGTDFRPVFRWAQDFQQEQGELAALVYLSDGYGDFPRKAPDFPTYFVLPRQGDLDFWFCEPSLPDWVRTV